MPVTIHGKQYMTVAERVNDFRSKHPDYTISTELISNNESIVIMKASILNGDQLLATGYAEEKRGATQINRTSALENCETSAIGRSLAALGFGGTEYASANEVENAIHQQMNPDPIDMGKVDRAVDFYKTKIDEDDIELNYKIVQSADTHLTNDERMMVAKKLHDLGKAPGSRKLYTTILREYMEAKEADFNNPDLPDGRFESGPPEQH